MLPQQYVVDDQDGIRDPLGMAGVRLEAKVHIVTTAVASAQNVIKCANRCNLQVADIVLESLASSQAVLEDDEKELGVALVDIGGGTCDVMVYADGAIVHTSVLPFGGGHVTNDIATVLRTPLDSAEKIKRKYGCAWRGHVDDGEQMEVPSVGGRGPRALPRMKLVEVIEPRIEEIFEHVKKELMRCGYFDGLAAGHRAHRRRDRDGRHVRGRRAGARAAHAARRADEDRRPRRRRALARVLDRRRPRDVRRRPRPRGKAAGARERQRGSRRHVQAGVEPTGRDLLAAQRRARIDAERGQHAIAVELRSVNRDAAIHRIEQLGRGGTNVGRGERLDAGNERVRPIQRLAGEHALFELTRVPGCADRAAEPDGDRDAPCALELALRHVLVAQPGAAREPRSREPARPPPDRPRRRSRRGDR